jgi:hypothetical protein
MKKSRTQNFTWEHFRTYWEKKLKPRISKFWAKIQAVTSQILEKTQNFGEKNAYWIEKVQLTVFYFGCLVDLIFLTVDLMDSFELEDTILIDLPILEVFDNDFFRGIFSPDRVFLMTYFLIEFVILRKTIKVSKLMQYHLMLTFTLLMCQGLALNLWDFFFHRDALTDAFLGGDGDEEYVDFSETVGTVLFNVIFWFFFYNYGKLWIESLQGKFSELGEGFRFISDSAAFWVKIRTPGLKKKYEESDEYEEND